MVKYDNDQLSELCAKFNLVDYVSQTRNVTRLSGHSYILCPFHEEKTPSCVVDEHRFYCFGCKAKGSAIDYMVRAEGLKFEDAVTRVANLTGSDMGALRQSEALAYYKSVRQAMFGNKYSINIHPILPNDTMLQFADEVPSEWVEEGISAETIKKFEVRIDHCANRIVYPVYNNTDELINVKGRTRFKNYKEMKIAKYMNYYKLGTVDFFAGMKQNRDAIMESGKIIIFEGIKSVMKLCDYGCNLGVSSETSHLNDEQIKILLQMGVRDVTIAYDSDVEIADIAEHITNLRRFTNVYATRATGIKMSPVDQGKQMWEKFYKERIRL